MAGIVGPDSFPIRDPRSAQRMNGRILNPVRFCEIGGFSSASKWAGGMNDMKVERPTGQTSTRSTTNKNVD